MRIIFLDIDGVLVNRQSLMRASGLRARGWPSCVAALNRVITETGAQIVVSSTWRYAARQMGFETPNAFVRETLRGWGVTGTVLGCTPDLSRKSGCLYAGAERGDEIQAWLDRFPRPVESFVIIDDDADMKHLTPYLIRTGTVQGMTEADADRAIEALTCAPPPSAAPAP